METLNTALATKLLYQSSLPLFTLKALRDILALQSDDTFYLYIRTLVRHKILDKIERGIYALTDRPPHTYTVSNFLHSPSYISFETALNFYGILSQFPYEITGATTNKSMKKTVRDTIYTYSHIQSDLYFGYEKKDEHLIALPEKALLDQIYFSSRGLRQLPLDEYDFSRLNTLRFKEFLSRVPKTKQFAAMSKSISTILHL